MEEQFDLAGAVAVILGLHIQEIRNMEGLGIRFPKNMGSGLQTAWKIWIELKPYAGDGGLLQPYIQALVVTPSPDTRRALADHLRQVFGVEHSFQARIDTIVTQSSYASLYHVEHEEAPPYREPTQKPTALRSDRNVVLWLLVIVYAVVWAITSIASANKSVAPAVIAIAVRAVCAGYLATQLQVKGGWWLSLGGLIPGNALLILFALVGYRLEDTDNRESSVHYTMTARVLLTAPLAIPILLAVILTIASPAYMAQFFEYPFGLGILAITLALLAIVASIIWFGFWKEKAATGLWISTAATAASWCCLLLIWLVLLGPAVVQLTRQFPELLQGDFSILQNVFDEVQ